MNQQQHLAEQVAAVGGVIRDAETMRFQIADATGWQGYYPAYGPAVALADDGYNRSGSWTARPPSTSGWTRSTPGT